MVDKREVGEDITLNISSAGLGDVAITNISYTMDAETSEVQFNSGFTKSIAFTGMSYSGSFEHAGSNDELRQALVDDEGFPLDPAMVTITVKESERTVQFTGVIVTSRSKDMPGDDRSSETYDFVAENVTIS